jgi:high affinity Mn2+ porin
MRPAFLAAAALAATFSPGTARGQVLGAQINLIGQRLQPLHSPYAGILSLRPTGDAEMTQAYGVYLGGALPGGLQMYLDVEMLRGSGISQSSGLGGVTNGDVIRQGTVDLGENPYVARAFLRYALALGGRGRDTLARAMDQAPMVVPTRRLEISAGKFAVTDLLDASRYANSTRLQFQNWGLFQNTAWDYAADTRGYSFGIAVAWIEPRWALRAASFLMPTLANGNILDRDVAHARGDEVELTLMPGAAGTVVRVLGYLNHARMGSYADAIRVAQQTYQRPNIVADDQPGRTKYGFGLNLEQPVADGGETGLFARLGWADGRNESFAFTEVDRHASAGLQLSGVRWGRRRDILGLGFVDHALAPLHREYLAMGGHGFLLGDGRLDYAHERILEAYYRIQLGRFVQVSPDMQQIWNPGYNRDRGPATVLALRVNARY